MKVCIKTYGCQMNERDSERIAVFLRRRGYVLTRWEAEADVIIVNTCSVREKAEDKALGKMRLLIASKEEHPDRIVGAVGCMVQQMGRGIFRKARGLDFAVGTRRLARVPEVLEAVRAGRRPIFDVGEEGGREDQGVHEAGRVTAFTSILFGCNRHCSYCVVPRVRGAEWSRPAADIIDEIRTLVHHGLKEVTLLGQSIMSYGRANLVWTDGYRSALGFTESLPQLLEALQGIPWLERIRFTSGHPSGCTLELIRAMAELPSVCEHLHLPLQSGSDRILDRMNRGYSAADYHNAVRRLRAALPKVAITTDVIVGFPSETLDDFEMTRALMSEIGFDNAFIFKYNPRPDTPAACWPDNVPEKEKLRRNHVLLDEQNRCCLALNQALVGNEVQVLIEGQSRRNAARWTGRTRTNKIVLIDASSALRRGDLLTVRIDNAKIQTLYGTVKQ
ncbi:MAG: tRNA (N6-isopentenyl adenosine(37)-C2)-methylthiotransferase MiaB [Verrucomicrobia bacterium]|nr:tRNA (N6-isopentenyl adenosine(37)-C2)-methylthiotransferase MiaB [Verrucomicrobiota bacterium]MCG2681011.1 tRNA (N6-isopentenyl adenosine(37)-C2)-methylthiotransferase MiaB [Kiritimatiellia bacterium]MBU4247791.1 tRNA (N6-isopentenyl adenosine(37)-C2)-methylthiotransferase MiaB [Verrucomicrobiota bacterium]MBU4292079.1 tRNA (N6-isopentenyl adenosine(37)-C2)-methylthiotransferase MiaB [Verrucomicrobiota bacterium]MBU4428915.1 tRNA (N6-isopentenyl adenosine(37)-C2)-methylthiotransferase MiaB 